MDNDRNYPLRVLLEMRPALDGHAGIPQEARLLFRGLRTLHSIEVAGLIQSSGYVLGKGLSGSGGNASENLATDRQLNRLSRVVISLKEGLFNAHAATVFMAFRQLLGGREELTHFDATHFQDFVWRALFARTLHSEDFDAVTTANYRIARVPWTAMHRCALISRKFGYALYPRLDTSDFDVMIAETPYPGTVSSQTRLVVRYHDAIPILMPHTISDKEYHQASHYHALRKNVLSGAHFACVSNATRKDLISIFPQVESRAVTIHNMVAQHYFAEDSLAARVPEIIRTRLNDGIRVTLKEPVINEERDGSVDYLLAVSTIEPRKNHVSLLSAWEHLHASRYPDLRLVIVGMLGWDHEAIVKKFKPWMERGKLFVLEDVPSPELRVLYKHARATVCPSFGEGFDFSGVEAMRCGGAVVASEIPVHREIYGDAAEYFSPYSTVNLVQAIVAVIDPAHHARRDELVREGAAISLRYTPEYILPKWQEFLQTRLGPNRAAKIN